MRDTPRRLKPRRMPTQVRARLTVEAVVEAAARVFRREGWSATTNRIAAEAGVSIGSLYEYFPNKEAILVAIAREHVHVAEVGIDAALGRGGTTSELVTSLQEAICASQRFPSHALVLVEDVQQVGPRLRERAKALRTRVVAALEERARAAGLDEPRTRARAAFAAIGPLSVQTFFAEPGDFDLLAPHYLAMAVERLT